MLCFFSCPRKRGNDVSVYNTTMMQSVQVQQYDMYDTMILLYDSSVPGIRQVVCVTPPCFFFCVALWRRCVRHYPRCRTVTIDACCISGSPEERVPSFTPLLTHSRYLLGVLCLATTIPLHDKSFFTLLFFLSVLLPVPAGIDGIVWYGVVVENTNHKYPSDVITVRQQQY